MRTLLLNVRMPLFEEEVLERLQSAWYARAMKMTFAIPDELGMRFRETVPAGERSALVAEFLRQKLGSVETSLETVCHRVNDLESLNRDMAGWECFDDQE